MLQAVAGYDPHDEWSRPERVPSYTGALRQGARGLRVGVPVNHLMPGIDESIGEVHEAALAALESAGCEIVELSMPDPEALYELTTVINKVEATAIHAEWIRTRPDDYNLSTISRVADGFEIPALRYIEVLNQRKRCLAEFNDTVFSKADALYAPLLPMEVPTIAETEIKSHNEAPVIVHEVTRCTRWVSYLGLPVLTLPCGFSPLGLPVACQLVGRPFDEATLLRIGDAFQKETNWHKRHPPMLDS
jgi:aspartyl-tRNA(Asn)/glutamyl-tRNA(Gln) amidotransferase subunit A